MEKTLESKTINSCHISNTQTLNIYRPENKNLLNAQRNKTYTIREIKTDDVEMKNFLFTLGCYKGEEVTVISVLADNYVISVKDARYSIDSDLASVILI